MIHDLDQPKNYQLYSIHQPASHAGRMSQRFYFMIYQTATPRGVTL